jgi:hypothetical protein
MQNQKSIYVVRPYKILKEIWWNSNKNNYFLLTIKNKTIMRGSICI